MTALISTHYMDEADRCHRLAYLAYGELLASGTAAEVVAASGLYTWTITGENVHLLAAGLKKLPGVEQVAPFGATLHVSGHDPALLQSGLADLDQRLYHCQESTVSLEDVFISLMQNRGGQS